MINVRVTKDMAWNCRVGFSFFDKDSRAVMEPCQMRVVDGGELIPVAFNLEHEETQALMDAIWDAGFRPSEGTGSAGALAATQSHLDDMKKIVFKSLKIQ